ncbi:hypothetical protein [Listeria booriae]|uniref:hypothetical protein n=1 Tax=Listeria booriae TaxID=1552123 RepID=UPI00164E967A|nr:hypothetical protein [Listeria booriae]MBC6300328.1 hypothetical protein [Listeria booriae]
MSIFAACFMGACIFTIMGFWIGRATKKDVKPAVTGSNIKKNYYKNTIAQGRK